MRSREREERGDEGKTALGNWSNGEVRKSRKRGEGGGRNVSTWKLVQWRGEKIEELGERGEKESQHLEVGLMER